MKRGFYISPKRRRREQKAGRHYLGIAEKDDISQWPLHLFSFMEDTKQGRNTQVVGLLTYAMRFGYMETEGCKKEREYALSRGKRFQKSVVIKMARPSN